MVDAPLERVLNPLLRRADWRFLLPDPKPQVSICFARGFLANAVQAISERMIDPQDESSGVCDLAVAIDPDQETLNAAWAALRAGGVCYTEWYSPSSTHLRIVKRKLRSAGFANVTCYWAWPLPARAPALFWIPVEASGAMRYFMTHRPSDPSVLRFWKRAIFRLLWRGARVLGFVVPICAVARKPMRADSSAQENISKSNRVMLDWVYSGWENWRLGPKPDRLSCLLLTGGKHSHNKAVGLVFAEPDPQPRIAVKMPRVTAAIPGLLREKTILEHLQTFRQNDLQGIPRVLFWERNDSFAILGETALTGVPLYTKLKKSNFRELALGALNWQVQLAGPSQLVPATNWWDRLVEPVLASFDESFGEVIDKGMFETAREILAGLGPLPLVCEQRDFSPWNVMVNANGQLAIFDWESAELCGLPAIDLIYFLVYAGFYLDGAWQSGRFRESYRSSLDRSTFIGSVHFEALADYTAQVGFEFASLRPLRLLTWMLHSRSEYQRLGPRGTRPSRESLRHSLFLSLWEEEMRFIDRKPSAK